MDTFQISRPSNSADSEGTEDSLKRTKRDGDLRHISVVYWTKAPAGLKIRGWIRTHGPPIIIRCDDMQWGDEHLPNDSKQDQHIKRFSCRDSEEINVLMFESPSNI
jgi:hypothetical protein